MRTRRAIFMSKVHDNSAPKMILGVCWGARDRSPFLAKPVNVVNEHWQHNPKSRTHKNKI